MNRRGTQLLGGLAALVGIEAAGVAAEGGDTFEGLVESATRVTEIDTLLLPAIVDCAAGRREIDRARCQGMRAFMRSSLPKRTFVAVVDAPEAVSVSDYDARVRGYRLKVSGCLACKEPVAGGTKRFVTLKPPIKGAPTLAAAVEVSEGQITFKDIGESEAWLKDVKPHLAAEFVFAPTEVEWKLANNSQGYAFRLLGTRVFDRCTGTVILSEPKSTGLAPRRPHDGCPGAALEAAVATDESAPAAPRAPRKDVAGIEPQLSSIAINHLLVPMRAEVDVCFDHFKMKGTAFLDFDVPGDGSEHLVTLRGTIGGTSMGFCVLDAARKIKFPPFQLERQKFTYPVVLSNTRK